MWEKLQAAFSPPALAAMRNVLTALAAFIGALGVAGLTQTNLQHLVDLIMSVGSATAILITALAALVAAVTPIIASFTATMAHQRASVSTQPNTAVVQTSSPAAMVTVANAIAAMPEAQQVISSLQVASITPSPKIVAAQDSVAVPQTTGA